MVIALAIPIIVFAVNQDSRTQAVERYFSVACGHYHYVVSNADNRNIVVFVDSETGYEWVDIEARLCIHDEFIFGIDILYERVNANGEIETRWICHGSNTMEEYVFTGRVCYYNECDKSVESNMEANYVDISPASDVRFCPRDNCNGVGLVTWRMVTDFVRTGNQRFCTKPNLFGVGLQYSAWDHQSGICSTCGTAIIDAMVQHFTWICYGFN